MAQFDSKGTKKDFKDAYRDLIRQMMAEDIESAAVLVPEADLAYVQLQSPTSGLAGAPRQAGHDMSRI